MTESKRMNGIDDIPRPEHPRPDFERADWLNLNGTWGFCYDADDTGIERRLADGDPTWFDESIRVPFAWQSALSGQQNIDYRGVAWYRRTFSVPPTWTGRQIFVRFGAVDYAARVWVNGHPIGEHEGGYSPFEFEISEALHGGENTLVVRVEDPANLYEIPHGKQASLPPDPWQQFSFTPSSGIWQTVWLEARPTCYIEMAHFTPDVSTQQVKVEIALAGMLAAAETVQITIQPPLGEPIYAALAADRAQIGAVVPIPEPQLWDIDTPYLYTVSLSLELRDGSRDRVETYFGMREIEQREGQVWLNGRPIYLITALDQGYWQAGIYTAPTDEALRADIVYAKQIGLNGLRKHLKIEDPRFNYWADQLGLLLWCDMPCPTLFSDVACARFRGELLAMVERDYNHPSIIVWCPYNETWGLEFSLQSRPDMQAWVAQLYDELKAVDPTRLVVDNSGWSHVKTDLADFHYYTGSPRDWRAKMTGYAAHPEAAGVFSFGLMADGCGFDGAPLMVSEFGYGWQHDSAWGLRWSTNELRRHAAIVGYTYCELYDVEYEYAGYALYDRTPKAFGYDLKDINSADFIVIDYQGGLSLLPDEAVTIPLYFSAYHHPPLEKGRLRWKLMRTLPSTLPEVCLSSGEFAFTPAPYTVTELEPIRFTVPNIRGAVALMVWVEDERGQRRARNRLDLEVFNPAQSLFDLSETGDSYVFTLSSAPGNKAKSVWNNGDHQLGYWVDDRAGAVWLCGSGSIEYRFPVVSRLGFPPVLHGLSVVMELGSRPEAITQSVVGRERPTDVTISLNGIELETVRLRDLHVHAGGALTRIHNTGVGEHGEWVEVRVRDDQLDAIVTSARQQGFLTLRLEVKPSAEHPGGLTVFGSRTGRYGIDPSIRIVVPKLA